MKIDFIDALEDCAGRIASGESDLDECLRRYPEYAAQLKPLLQAAIRVERGRRLVPSAVFKVRARSQLMAHVRAYPRRRSWVAAFSTPSLLWRLGTALAVLVLAFFLTGTAFAQNALPGQALYGWKLSSEQVWRAVSPDPVGVDLALADRRAYEITAESSDAGQQAEAVKGYEEVLSRLASENDVQNEGRIIQTLELNQKKFSAAGVEVPGLESLLSTGKPGYDNLLHGKEGSTSVPASVPSAPVNQQGSSKSLTPRSPAGSSSQTNKHGPPDWLTPGPPQTLGINEGTTVPYGSGNPNDSPPGHSVRPTSPVQHP